MNKYEVFQEMDQLLNLVQQQRNALRNKLRDDQNRIIHEVLGNVDIVEQRVYYAYVSKVVYSKVICVKEKVGNSGCYTKFQCWSSGNGLHIPDGVRRRFGDAFANALQKNYHTIVERIKNEQV